MSKKCRKKSVCAVVVMVAMLCISGCGSGKIKSDKVLRVGVVTYTQDDPFINALADKLKENLKSMETEDMKITVSVKNGNDDQQDQNDDPPAVAAEAIGIAIHSQEPPVWILSTRLIPCYDGGPQKCGRRDKKQEPLHQQRLWLCKKTGINSRDACSYEQLRTSASA